MTIQFEAVYENGAFRPLKPIDLPENKRVTVTVELDKPADEIQVEFVLPPDRWEAFCEALDAPPRVIPAIQKLFAKRD